jgi:hypothetical protein
MEKIQGDGGLSPTHHLETSLHASSGDTPPVTIDRGDSKDQQADVRVGQTGPGRSSSYQGST